MAGALADFILTILAGVPDVVKVVVIAMLPITEYQLAIPLAMERFHFSAAEAYGLAFLGSSFIFFPLYFGLDHLRNFLERFLPKLLAPLDKLLERGKRKLHANYVRYGAFALFLFLMIPFPLTGVWTATFAAVALKIPLKPAAAGILLGVLAGQGIVTIIALGATHVL